jgi:hypothetical protein
LFAGFSIWLVSKLATALDLFALGVLPDRIIAEQLVESFVSILLAVICGAWIYRE